MGVVSTLFLAEIEDRNGRVEMRYSRYLSDDGTCWIRHGLFCQYHPNGSVASEGMYENGRETGVWRNYFENGVLAAEGTYLDGREHGVWRFFYDSGTLEEEVEYIRGERSSGS